MARKKQVTLYEQVKTILNTLQGDCVPNYQGMKAFWLNPEVFLSASLYGQKLIANEPGASGHGSGGGCCPSMGGSGSAQKPAKESCCGSSDGPTINLSNSAISSVNIQPSEGSVGDCWPDGESTGDPTTGDTTRSRNSAIIIGLKGEYPFDGSIYPRLMWDSDLVASSDQIQTIANWIDAGCPLTLEEEAQNKTLKDAAVKTNLLQSLASGKTAHPVSIQKVKKDSTDEVGLTVRKEVSSLSPEELTTFREALGCMMTYNDYWQDERSFDYWARIHTNSCQHGWEQFLPWHRLYLYFFEQKLQDYDSSIALPYWSWSDYADLNKTSFNNVQFDLGILPEAYGCFLKEAGFTKLKNSKDADGKSLFTSKQIAGLEAIYKSKDVYQSGLRFLTAAGIDYDIINVEDTAKWNAQVSAVYNVLKKTNPLWFPNRWPGAMGGSTTYPTPEDIEVLLAIQQWNDFGGGPSNDHHFGSLEKVHNGMHNFSGGTNPNYPGNIKGSSTWANKYAKLGLTANPQSEQNPPYGWMTDNRITAFDPIFWAHHSNVDRLWALWQERHSGKPESTGALAPWSMSVEDTYSITNLGYSYQKDSVYYDVNSNVGLTKFHSEKSNVSSNTLDTHRKAEIKIHRMRRGNLQNAHIRVFLNQPKANTNTKTVGNDHFVEEITTFHGSCYGGPGHCRLPLDRTRRHDKRPLHHHEPRNYKIDATQAIKRMMAKGEKDITIQLVIVGINGQPIDNAVFIDGVSLNFMD